MGIFRNYFRGYPGQLEKISRVLHESWGKYFQGFTGLMWKIVLLYTFLNLRYCKYSSISYHFLEFSRKEEHNFPRWSLVKKSPVSLAMINFPLYLKSWLVPAVSPISVSKVPGRDLFLLRLWASSCKNSMLT